MEIKRSGSQPSRKGPAENFTGSVRIDPLFDPPDPARTFGALVTFEPGARTAWHTHPLGQTLIVTSGCGWTQCWGEPNRKSGRRRNLVSARQERMGTAGGNHRDVAYRHRGEAQRQGGRLDGKGQRRAISGLSRRQTGSEWRRADDDVVARRARQDRKSRRTTDRFTPTRRPVDPGLNEAIDAAYVPVEYRRYQMSIVNSRMSPKAQSVTIRLLPALR